MNLSEIAEIANGQLVGDDLKVTRYIRDGRSAMPERAEGGDCYIALKGERFNGHEFFNQAFEHGATSAIVSEVRPYPFPYVLVVDTQDALVALAKHARAQFKQPVLALTGSCGKTTVKEMIRSILPATAFATPGNLNNHIGVPFSLLSLKPEHSHAIFELGANHLGEIQHLAEWVKPDFSLITIIAPAHLEGFGSTEGVAKTKGEIFSTLPQQGIALVNADDQRVVEQAKRHNGQQKTFGIESEDAQYKAINLQFDATGCYQWQLAFYGKVFDMKLNVPGKHNVMNGLIASVAAMALGCDMKTIQAGLAKFSGVSGRLAIKLGRHGEKLLDDTYNANLRSVIAAIDVLAQYPGKKIFVLGDLSEVGESLPSHYQEIGQYARKSDIDLMFTCGQSSQAASFAFDGQSTHFEAKDALVAALRPHLDNDVTVLVKGSRSAQMEHIIQSLEEK